MTLRTKVYAGLLAVGVATFLAAAPLVILRDDGPAATITSPTTTAVSEPAGRPATEGVVESLPGGDDGAESPSPEAASGQGPTTTVFEVGGPSDPWGPVLCAAEPHPRHHYPCGQAPTTTVVPPNSVANPGPVGATGGSGACGGDLPPCWVMMQESGGDIRAVNPPPYGCSGNGCYGKWQFDLTTSQALGYPLPMSEYDEATQDQAARTLWAGGAGCAAWAAC